MLIPLGKPNPTSGGSLPSMAGNALRRLRVGIDESAAEWSYDTNEVINVEEARSDIRSTTRGGAYANFDSQPGLQALVDIAGPGKTFLLPPNSKFKFFGKTVELKSVRSFFTSFGGKAEINSGCVKFGNATGPFSGCIFSQVSNMYFTGAHSYAIDVAASLCSIHDCVMDGGKTVAAINLATAKSTYAAISNTFISNNSGDGIVAHYPDSPPGPSGDFGDVWIINCRIIQNRHGIKIGRLGGLYVTGTKCQTNSGKGLYFYTPSDIATPCWGHYIGNSGFEGNAQGDVVLEAAPGAAYVPERIEFAGGTIGATGLINCSDITFSSVLLSSSFSMSSAGCNKIQIFGYPPVAITQLDLDGEGNPLPLDNDFVVFGIHPIQGPVIRSGKNKFTLLDGDGNVSNTIFPLATSVSSTPLGIGQFAKVGSVGYMAIGTSSPADWKQITN